MVKLNWKYWSTKDLNSELAGRLFINITNNWDFDEFPSTGVALFEQT